MTHLLQEALPAPREVTRAPRHTLAPCRRSSTSRNSTEQFCGQNPASSLWNGPTHCVAGAGAGPGSWSWRLRREAEEGTWRAPGASGRRHALVGGKAFIKMEQTRSSQRTSFGPGGLLSWFSVWAPSCAAGAGEKNSREDLALGRPARPLQPPSGPRTQCGHVGSRWRWAGRALPRARHLSGEAGSEPNAQWLASQRGRKAGSKM